jgi:hypothetical protein
MIFMYMVTSRRYNGRITYNIFMNAVSVANVQIDKAHFAC